MASFALESIEGLIFSISVLAVGLSGRGLGESFNLVDIILVEVKVAGTHDSLCLLRIAGADDGSGHGGMAQRPGDCDFTDRTVVSIRHRTQTLDQRQIVRNIRFRKVGMPPPPVVRGQTGRALASHSAGQQTGSHRGINDDANALTQAVGQNLVFDLTVYQRIPRLQRSYGRYGLGTAELLNREVRDSNPAYLAFALQVGECRPSFFQFG